MLRSPMRFIYCSLILLFIFSFTVTYAQGTEFTENFDDPAIPGWEHTQGVSVVDGALRIEPGNFAHRGGEWSDFRLVVQFRYKGQGALAISFCSGPDGGYHLLIDGQRLVLQREAQGRVDELKAVEVDFSMGKWYEINIETLGGEISVKLSGENAFIFNETESVFSGGFGFETLGDMTAEIDQVILSSLEEGQTQSEDTNPEVALPTPGAPAYQSENWVYTGGPIGGLGYDIRIDPRNPDVMYATDAWAGAFKSVDGGKSWLPINTGITARVGPSGDGIPVFSLTVDPNNPDTLWAGTQFGGGVFRSDNGGQNWRSLSNGIQERALTIRGFTVEPGNSDVVYLGGEISSWEWNVEPLPGLGLDMVKGVVYKTTDGGQNWTRIWYGDNLTRYIWIHPEDHNLIYVSTGIFDREAANSNPDTINPGGVGILRSRDGGATWEVLGVENGIRAEELYFGSLFMHPQNPDILIGAAGNDPYMWALGHPIGAIYHTKDGGDSWTRVLDLPNASAVEICESDPDVVYAASLSSFYRSDDGGFTWEKLGGDGATGQTGYAMWGPPDVIAGFPIDMQCDPRDPMRIFVNNYGGGNFLSEDGGQHWVDSSRGYTGALLHRVIVAQDNPAMVYASARSGLFASVDGGDTWQGMSRGLARALEGAGIAVDPQDSLHIIATIGDAGPIPKLSNDGGQTWSESEPGVGDIGFFEWGLMKNMYFSLQLPGRVIGIQGEVDCGEKGTCADGHGVIYSDDGGETWRLSNLSEGMALDLAFAPDGSMVTAIYPGDIYRSLDDGQSWELVAQNIDAGVTSINSDPDLQGPMVRALAVDPENANKLYAGFFHGGVMLSEDGGSTWSVSSSGLNPETTVNDLVTDLAHPGVVYAATIDSGVFVSVDGGATWQAINSGLLTRAAVNIALSNDGSVLYLATMGGGVFRLGSPRR